MIRNIHIRNFKSILDTQFELGRINVLIGANGSGKSNILEAIAFAGAAAADKLDNEFLANRGIRIVDSKDIISHFTDLKSSNNSINVSIGKFDLAMYLEGDAYPVFSIYSSFSKEEQKLYNLPKDQIRNEATVKILEKFLLYAPEESALRNFYKDGQIEPLGIKGEGLFKLIKILKLYEDDEKHQGKPFAELKEKLQLIDWFQDVEIGNGSFSSERYLKIKDKYLDELTYFDQRSTNEGFLFLLFYLALFISPDTPSFFAIDNIENALNPKLCSKLMVILNDLAIKHDKQVIFTTHNPAILDGINLNDDEQRLFVVDRNIEGHTKINRIQSKKGRASKIKLSEAFMKGFIGGVPNNF